MKPLLLFFFLFLSFLIQSQNNNNRVTIEDATNPKYQSDMERVRSIRSNISKAWEKIEDTQGRPTGNTKNDLKKWKNHNLTVKAQLASSNIDSKCKEALAIQRKWNKSFTEKKYPCNGVASRLKRINELILEAKNKLNNTIKNEKKVKSIKITEIFNKENHKKKITELNSESKRLDEALNKRKKKKYKSIDDFINQKNISQKNLKKSIKTFKSKRTKSLFGQKTNTKSKSLSKKIGIKNKELKKENFKITNKGNRQGVVDGNGIIIIPFRNWTINSYKYGFAEVSIPFDSFKCTAFDEFTWKQEYPVKAIATKVGYVDSSGNFIDGFEISVSGGGVYRGIWLVAIPNNETYDQRKARERRAKNRKRKKAQAKKKCEIQVKQWKLNIISRN